MFDSQRGCHVRSRARIRGGQRPDRSYHFNLAYPNTSIHSPFSTITKRAIVCPCPAPFLPPLFNTTKHKAPAEECVSSARTKECFCSPLRDGARRRTTLLQCTNFRAKRELINLSWLRPCPPEGRGSGGGGETKGVKFSYSCPFGR